MPDLTSRKKPADPRQAKIRCRRIQHEVSSMRTSLEKFEIDILESEANIERSRESIKATEARIAEKESELQLALKAMEELDNG